MLKSEGERDCVCICVKEGEGEFIKDVIADVLCKNPVANNFISLSKGDSVGGDNDFTKIKVNVFRYQQSLDDPAFLYWKPGAIANKEWPYIYLLKL